MILAALVGMLAVPAQAGFITGNRLHGVCTAQNAEIRMLAMGYAIGVFDSLKSSSKISAFFCAPDEITTDQVRDVACAYVAKNPESRHKDASLLVFGALVEAWPCGNTPAK